jgi:hypothetical protein
MCAFVTRLLAFVTRPSEETREAPHHMACLSAPAQHQHIATMSALIAMC